VWEQAGGEALLVDCAGEPAQILAVMQEHDLRLRTVVLTHGHMDHTESLGRLVQRTGAQVLVHARDAAMLHDPMLSGAALFGFPHENVSPEVLLEEGATVSLPGTEVALTVLHTPGHSPGSLCLSGGEVLFSGDALFAGSIGRMDLPGGDEEQMMASLARLMELPDATTVYPGHGPPTTIGEERAHNPWLEGW
jgi:glyoxylase-like metal-dependent hydrolase (beta-lactamase superfamily II)